MPKIEILSASDVAELFREKQKRTTRQLPPVPSKDASKPTPSWPHVSPAAETPVQWQQDATPPLPQGDRESPSGVIQPVGVSTETYEFLETARAIGADKAVDERRRGLIYTYNTTGLSLTDLTSAAGVKTKQRVGQLITSGMKTIWEYLPADIQENYPREQVVRLKDTRAMVRESNKGKSYSQETRAKISDALRGRVLSPETRARIGQAQRGKKRRPLIPEHRAKLTEAKKYLSPETRAKLSEARTGKRHSQETRARIREALKGRVSPTKGRRHTQEVRNKISTALKELWRERRSERTELN